jgi:hypothetical protein
MKSDGLLNTAAGYFEHGRLNDHGGGGRGRRVSAAMCRRDTERRGEFLITLQVDVVDPHFAGLNTIHYLLKVFVFDLQSVTD